MVTECPNTTLSQMIITIKQVNKIIFDNSPQNFWVQSGICTQFIKQHLNMRYTEKKE
jgi:hypothetical protein